MNNFLLWILPVPRHNLKKGLMKSQLQTPQFPGQDLQGCLLSGTALKIHLGQYHSQLEGRTLLFSPNKRECLKKAGNYTSAWRTGLGIRWFLRPFQPKPAWFYGTWDRYLSPCKRRHLNIQESQGCSSQWALHRGRNVQGWFCWRMQEVSTLTINAKGTWCFMDVVPNMLTELPLDHYEFCTSCAFYKMNCLKCFPLMQFFKIHLAVWTSTSANNKLLCLELRRSYKPLPSIN